MVFGKQLGDKMTEQEIIKHINDGAIHYIRMFANAEHMESHVTDYYSYIKPRADEHGISFAFDIKIEKLPAEQQKKLVEEIKALSMPVWLDLNASDEVFWLFFGREKVHGQRSFAEDDEIYMAVLKEEWQIEKAKQRETQKVHSAEEFAMWAKLNNDVLANGYADMHQVYHYPVCANGLLNCYIAYDGTSPVAIAGIMVDRGAASLEFVATVPEARRKGFARAVCEQAVSDAFDAGVQIVTVRAANLAAGRLYEKLGFKAYNYVL